MPIVAEFAWICGSIRNESFKRTGIFLIVFVSFFKRLYRRKKEPLATGVDMNIKFIPPSGHQTLKRVSGIDDFDVGHCVDSLGIAVVGWVGSWD